MGLPRRRTVIAVLIVSAVLISLYIGLILLLEYWDSSYGD
jgi:hypothetical protein